jgi:hypothetical protein
MMLPRRCLIWIMIVAMFSAFGAVGIVAVTIAKLNGQAAIMRTELAVSFLRTKLDGNAVSARSLALIAEDLLPGFNQRLVIAVFDPTGVVVAASRSDLVGDPAPRAWLDASRALQTGHWQSGVLGTYVSATSISDPNGRVIGGVAVEDHASSLPLISRLLRSVFGWLLLFLLIFFPACWFGTQLIMAELGRIAAAGTDLFLGLRKTGKMPSDAIEGAGADFTALGARVEQALDGYRSAIEIVSDVGDRQPGPGPSL